MKQEIQMALVKLDGRGRIVIPQGIREKAGFNANDVLFVYTFEKLVFLRRAEIEYACP